MGFGIRHPCHDAGGVSVPAANEAAVNENDGLVLKGVALAAVGIAALTTPDYYLLRDHKRKRWNVIWNVSSSGFSFSGKKEPKSRKFR